MDLFSKEMLSGLGSAIAVCVTGFMAFSRYWVNNRASNANDNQHIDMLERQEKYIERLERNNESLRADNAAKDETIRQYWKTLTETQARLQIIETSQKHLEAQNESLKQKVSELTVSNKELISEITKLRASLGGENYEHQAK